MKKIIAMVLAVVMTVTSMGVSTKASAEGAGTGKYVSDVYFAYGKTEEEAVQWLKDNGWEPIKGSNDFNAGKESVLDSPMAVSMGIKRTDKADEAITDMAVMNMTGGYSFPDYDVLLTQKETEIYAFIKSFLPVIEEYRANYNGEGSAYGKKRAELAHMILNKFYDGGEDEPYAKYDTGLPLGDLLLAPTIDEGNKSGGSLQQILLESSSYIIILMETMLALAADDGEDTWVERLETLSGDGLLENLEKYVPEAAGQNVSPSVAEQYLNERFGDTAGILAAQWDRINEDIVWYEGYCTDHGLWPSDQESADDYDARVSGYFAELQKADEENYNQNYGVFKDAGLLYSLVYDIPYAGDWGETLGDFFNPAGGEDYSDPANFLPFAAALSDGQRAAAELLSLRNLLLIGSGNEEALESVKPELDAAYQGDESYSVYSGMNRGIFRGLIAITSDALMAQNMGAGDAFSGLYGNLGVLAISSYAAAGLGVVGIIAGAVLMHKGIVEVRVYKGTQDLLDMLDANTKLQELAFRARDAAGNRILNSNVPSQLVTKVNELNRQVSGCKVYETRTTTMAYVGRGFLAAGAVLMISAAFVEGYQLYEYYQKDFTPIPQMIVDEADIVSYTQDENGKNIKHINFDQYAYYSAALCNRQEVGQLSDWQSGVESYAEWGCGDVADLNGDFGQEWLALYTVSNTAKGNPILADSLTLQYGSAELPKGCTQKLHFFTMTNAVDLGDTAYSYNNDKGGVYFFWDSDENAVAGQTASSFTGGQMALAGAGGLVIGLLAATLVFLAKRKKKDVQAA